MHYERVSMSKTINLLMCLCLISEIFCIFAFESTYSMKKIVYIALLCSLLFALGGCNGQSSSPHRGSRWEATLSLADSLMRTRPDSALKLLYSLTPEGKPFPLGEGWGEAYYLLLLDAQNKCDTIFRSDTLQRALVSYYDRHGTPNERMRAYYLLGRACHDMGESPRALDCYQQAIDCADTTSTDCDYYTLMCIHSQKRNLFKRQRLSKEELTEISEMTHCAWKAKDTLTAIMSSRHKISAFYALNQPDSVIFYSKRGFETLKQHGLTTEAYECLGQSVMAYLQLDRLKEAYETMQQFEQHVEILDKTGSIYPDYLIYYYNKGELFMRMNQIDSALYAFRQEFSQAKDYNNKIASAHGLSLVYEKLHIPDSVAKYAKLAYSLNDSAYSENLANHLRQMETFYNYMNIEKIAAKRKQELEKTHMRIGLGIIFSIFSITIAAFFIHTRHRHQLHQKDIEKSALRQEFTDKLQLLYYANKELEQLAEYHATSSEKRILEKEKETQILQKRLSQLEEKMGINGEIELLKTIQNEPAYQRFIMIQNDIDLSPNRTDWNALFEMMERVLPQFKTFLINQCNLNQNEYKVCVLLRLHFSLYDIGIMTGRDSSSLANLRRRMARKIYKRDMKPKDFDEMIISIR